MSANQSRIHFFGEDYIFFSEMILTPDRTLFELEQIISIMNLNVGAQVLDLGCGQGRLAVPLAERYYQVTAFDGSEILLEEVKRRASKAGVCDHLRIVQGELRELDDESRYDAIINIGTAFGYYDHEDEDFDVLCRIARALKPGGVFIQDTENRDFKLSGALGTTYHDMGGIRVVSNRSYDCITGRWQEKLEWEENGQIVSRLLDLRLYSATELVNMTQRAGLEVTKVNGLLDGTPLDLHSPRLVIVSRKGSGLDG